MRSDRPLPMTRVADRLKAKEIVVAEPQQARERARQALETSLADTLRNFRDYDFKIEREFPDNWPWPLVKNMYDFIKTLSPGFDGGSGGSGGTGSQPGTTQTVTVATTAKTGIVKPDGTTITVTPDGTISANIPQVTIPQATNTSYGVVKPDGVTIIINAQGLLEVVPSVDLTTTEVSRQGRSESNKDLWIDGSEVYQEVLELTTGASQEIHNTLKDVSYLDIERVIDIKGTVRIDNIVYPLNSMIEKDSFINVSLREGVVLEEYHCGNMLSRRPVTIIICCTKKKGKSGMRSNGSSYRPGSK